MVHAPSVFSSNLKRPAYEAHFLSLRLLSFKVSMKHPTSYAWQQPSSYAVFCFLFCFVILLLLFFLFVLLAFVTFFHIVCLFPFQWISLYSRKNPNKNTQLVVIPALLSTYTVHIRYINILKFSSSKNDSRHRSPPTRLVTSWQQGLARLASNTARALSYPGIC